MNDFERVARVIRFLDGHYREQPGLAELAHAAGLSESHFHRLFQRWAGVTPKDFLQCLSLEHARRRLRESASVLDAALEVGLSGPGRLHDLSVTLEAATPGEMKSGGEGMRVDWGLGESPFGRCSVGWTSRGFCHLAFVESADEGAAMIGQEWPRAVLHRDDASAGRQLEAVFYSEPSRQGLRAYVRGTPFQVKVWRTLLNIPEGGVVSYRTLASAVCGPNAARAVGAACGSNSLAYLIPCHRVIRETGIVEGYRWGTVRKKAMLARESVVVPARPECVP